MLGNKNLNMFWFFCLVVGCFFFFKWLCIITCRAQVPMGLYLHLCIGCCCLVVLQRMGIQTDTAWLVDRRTWGLTA